MPDVRRLVRIDIGVLDNDFARRFGLLLRSTAQQTRGIKPAIQPDINIPVARYLQARYTRNALNIGCQFFGNLLRRTLQLARQLKSHRNRQFPKRTLFRLLQRHLYR